MEDLPSYVTPMRNTGCSPPDDCSLLESNSYAPSYTPAGLAFSQSLAIWFSGAMVVTKNLGIGIDAKGGSSIYRMSLSLSELGFMISKLELSLNWL